jgi:hypothetical protein
MTKSKKHPVPQVSKQGVKPQVVVVTHNPQTGKKKKKNRKVHSLKSTAFDAAHYKEALLNPFSDMALGCRVPDKYFAPTATVALREIVSLSNDTAGMIECVVMPNLYQPVFSGRSNISNGVTATLPDANTYQTATILNSSVALYNKLVNYRIVSWGLRIRNTTAVTNAAGVLTVALVPPHERMRVPQNASIGNQTAFGTGAGNFNLQNWYAAMGIPYTGSGSTARVDQTSLLDFPYHARYQGTQLSEETFEVHPKMTDPKALSFRDSNDSYWGSDMQSTTSAIYVQPGDATYLFLDGWTSVVIGYQGGSATAGTQTFDIELVYHVEGSPNVQSGTVFITDAPVVRCDPLACEIVQAALNMAPVFTKVGGAAMAAYRSFKGS